MNYYFRDHYNLNKKNTTKVFKKFLYITTVFISFSIMENQEGSAMNPYEDIFTRDIYDVSTAKQSKFNSAKELPVDNYNRHLADLAHKEAFNNTTDTNQHNVAILYYQKLHCVYKHLTHYLVEDRNFLEAARKKIITGVEVKGGTGILKDVMGAVVHWATSAISNPIKAVANAGCHLAGALSGTLGGQDLEKKTCLGELEKAIAGVNKEINKLEEGVFNEPIKSLEEKYIKIKNHLYMQEDLQNTIEDYFINSRKPSYPFPFVKKCLHYALDLPQEHKTFIAPRDRLRDFRGSELFQRYSLSTREGLENVLVNMLFSSDRRTTCYLYGEPGIGKSTAIQELVEFLGLPFYKAKIRSIQDLTADNLEGSEALSSRVNTGWLVKPLLASNKNGEKYKNSVLILEDFDRVLLDPNSGATGLSFFLDYLDPLTTSFFSPYFNAEIDISSMHIFVTGNSPIPDSPEYQALKERFTERISFTPMDSSIQKEILAVYLEKLEKSFNIQINDLNSDQRRDLVNIAMATAEYPTSIRNLKGTLSSICRDFVAGGWTKVENRKTKIEKKEKTVTAPVTEQNANPETIDDLYQFMLNKKSLSDVSNEVISVRNPENMQKHTLQLILENPSQEILNSIKQRELGLFCEGDKLFCKVHDKEKIEIMRSDNFTKGIHSEHFDRIVNTLQDIVDPTYLQAGVAQEDDKNHKAASKFHNAAYEQITWEDEQVLLQYILSHGYADLQSNGENVNFSPIKKSGSTFSPKVESSFSTSTTTTTSTTSVSLATSKTSTTLQQKK